ncbi:MAG: GNAT family N-acetyltransferase [Magnetococcales bacterium]|nr:GNAT family N-acetyltransferase [Magnetococcales bacterium]
MNFFYSEKEFFLDVFRGRTLCFALVDHEATDAFPSFTACLEELSAAEVRSVVFVIAASRGQELLERFLAQGQDLRWQRIEAGQLPDIPPDLWKRKSGIFPVAIHASDLADFLDRIVQLARRWRISRMMLLERHGGLKDGQGRLVNFINFGKLSELTAHSRMAFHPLLELLLPVIQGLLSHGVAAVGLCRMEEVQRELFTYEGSGTFFSCRHYCEVRLLVWDDFSQVATLIHQGVKEGFLLPRSEERISNILLNGFGAFISGRHLAGVAALVTEGYEAENAGEVVALYALTRYQGEGIGVRLVKRLKEEGRRRGLHFLFSCTRQSRVMEFFQRQGFITAEHQQIPRAKWQGYDLERKESVRCFIFPLKGV